MQNRTLGIFLVDLIKGLSKAEKKHFHIYAKRNAKERELKFLHLFDYIDKTPDVNEDLIRRKFSELSPGQISDIKAHLYEQILISLRLLYRKNHELTIREQIDQAYILYSRGLYQQSLFILAKAKTLAQKWHRNNLCFEIIEFEKLIESRHITRSTQKRAEELTSEALSLRKSMMADGGWSDLALQMYDQYLKIGHVKNEEEFEEVQNFFEGKKSLLDIEYLSFYGKVFMYQSQVWYYYICQNFKKGYAYARKWVELFDEEPVFKEIEAELYIKGLHNLLAALYYCTDKIRYVKYFNILKKYVNENEVKFGENLKLRAFNYIEMAEFNLFFSEGRFEEGITYLQSFQKRLADHINHIDQHRVMVFNYKIACMHFGMGNYKESIKYLNEIINRPNDSLREDIQSFSRILMLAAHFELDNKTLLEYQVKSVSRFLKNIKENQKTQELLLRFFEKNLYKEGGELKIAFERLRVDLLLITQNPFEKRALLYLDLLSWIESKIRNVPVMMIIREKFLAE